MPRLPISLDFLLAEDCNLEVTKKRRFSKYDTLQQVQITLKEEFNIAPYIDTRIWAIWGFGRFSGEYEQLTPLDIMLKDLRLPRIELITIEVKNEDGSWPRSIMHDKDVTYTTVIADTTRTNKPVVESSKGDIGEIQDKLKIKKEEQLENEKNIKFIELKQKELEKEKNGLLAKMKEANDEIKTLEVTRDLFIKLDLEPYARNNKIVAFLTKSIEEKEAALECPVCLETARAPIFMCQQQHLICFKCRPRLASCPECRETYQGLPRRHRYAERDAEELEKMRTELTRTTS